MSKKSRVKGVKRAGALQQYMSQSFPNRTFLCRKCGRSAVIGWRDYSIGQVVECRNCGEPMHIVKKSNA